MTTTAKVYFREDEPLWELGEKVKAAGTDIVIGVVTYLGAEHNGRTYAEIVLTPAALGVGYERPVEGEEEEPFG